jgi:hypothetical protein
MPARWFFTPYMRLDPHPFSHQRINRMQEFTAAIHADGGEWSAFECGGGPGTDFALGIAGCKVRASDATLTAISSTNGFTVAPASAVELDQPLTVLTNPQRNFIERTVSRSLGYTDAEIDTFLGGQGIESKTWGQFLDFLASRRYTPVYEPTGTQAGYQGVVYPGVLAVDGRTTSTGATSVPRDVGLTPAQVAADVPTVG